MRGGPAAAPVVVLVVVVVVQDVHDLAHEVAEDAARLLLLGGRGDAEEGLADLVKVPDVSGVSAEK